jgi:hypothetical protein
MNTLQTFFYFSRFHGHVFYIFDSEGYIQINFYIKLTQINTFKIRTH